MKLIGQKRVAEHVEHIGKTTPIRRAAVRETSALRYNGDLSDDPPNGCTMVLRVQKGPQLGPTMSRYVSLSDSLCEFLQSDTNRNGFMDLEKMFTTETDCGHNPYHVLESDSI